MALVGVVFLLLGVGQASAQTATAMTDTMVNDYDRRVAVVTFSQPVWGNVPDGAFTVSGNVVVGVAGLPTSSPGATSITITFNADLVPGTDNVVYTAPATAALRLMTTDGPDTDSDPDEAASPITAAVAEEVNAPVLPDIDDVAVTSGATYTTPVTALPSVMGASGVGTITYSVSPTGPAGLTVSTTAGATLGQITGGPVTAADGDVVNVTWTATDSATSPVVVNGQFRILVQQLPGMPGNLTAVPGDGTVTLSWTAPTGAEVTFYEYRQDNGTWMSTGGTGTTHTVRGLNNGTSYAFQVRARNTAGPGPASSAVAATPVAALVAPGMPGTLTAVAGSGSVTLSWTAPTTGGTVASYEYQQTVGGVPSVWMPTTMGTGTTHTVSGLTNGVTYSFQVRARNAAGPGPVSNIATVTPAAGPARGIRSVSIGTIGEGGQAQATVSLTGPVPAGQFVRVKLRLVGKLHTRQNGRTGAPFASTPFREQGGVRTYLSGELAGADYDANVAGELTIQAGQSSGQVTVYTTTDDDAEDELLLLQAIPDNRMFDPNSDHAPPAIQRLGGAERLFWIDDSHEQGYALTAVPSKIYEAGTRATVSTVHFTPNFRRVDDRVSVTLRSDHDQYSALFANGLNTMTLPADSEGVTAQFQLMPLRRPAAACTCDGDRVDDEVTVNAVIGGEVVATTMIEVVDVHKLPSITVTAMTKGGAGPLTELAEGVEYRVKVEADRNTPSGEVTGETVTVTLPLADSSVAMGEDYRLTPASVSISGSSNDQSKTFTLEVLGGDGDIGEEMLVLDAMVKGGSVNGGGTEMKGMLSVTLVDTTTLNVEPKSDVEVELAVTKARNEGEGPDNLWTAGDDDLSIMLGDLFKLPSTGFNISADAMSADTDVVMAEADSTGVTLKAMGPGTTMVTVTATTAATSVGTQISANIATVEFEIMVDKLDLVLMLSGPEDVNLVEGMEAMLTVMANQMVAEDIEVMIMRDRAESSASEDDYEVGMLMIEAGEMSGMTMVMAVEDNMAEDMEELVLYAMAGDMEVDGEVHLYLWDAAVPALPVIAQFLLAAFLAIGGYRRYRRR